MPSDQEIINAVLAGDKAQFAVLVDRYQRRLLGLLWHACGNRQLAEDLCQETFFRAFRKLKLFSGQSLFYTWLARIASNLSCSYHRKKRLENRLQREGFEATADSLGAAHAPSEDVELSETQELVRQAINMLDENRRIVLLLRDFEEMDYESIAQILDLPLGTVRSRLHRARLELKELLQGRSAQLGTLENP
jgi:RNA polymerase sigma-70 factor (ECF subfamily)